MYLKYLRLWCVSAYEEDGNLLVDRYCVQYAYSFWLRYLLLLLSSRGTSGRAISTCAGS